MRVLAGDGDRPAEVVLPVVAQVSLAERDAPPLGVEEAEEQIHHGRLARSTGPQQRDPAPGFEAEAEAVQHEWLLRRVTSTHVVERHHERRRGDGGRLRGVGNRGLPIDQLQYPPAGAERRRQLAGHRRQRLHRLEGGEREQGEHRDEHAIELTPRVRTHREREHDRHRQAGHQHAEAVSNAGGQRIAAADSHERLIGGSQASERGGVAAVHDELRRGAEELHQLGREHAASRRLPPGGPLSEPGHQHGHGDPGGEQPDREGERRRRQEGCRGAHAERAGEQGDERGTDTAQVEVLERVHVGHHS